MRLHLRSSLARLQHIRHLAGLSRRVQQRAEVAEDNLAVGVVEVREYGETVRSVADAASVSPATIVRLTKRGRAVLLRRRRM